MAYTCQQPDPVSETWTFRSSAIAKRVLQALSVRKMMQKELADLVGFRPQQISRILRGDVNLTMKTIAKLEVALGIRLLEVPSGSVGHVGRKRASGPSGTRQKQRRGGKRQEIPDR
jgi:transcriptional regulator with XRE-family HTH domain